jgi:hypothetical protein
LAGFVPQPDLQYIMTICQLEIVLHHVLCDVLHVTLTFSC